MSEMAIVMVPYEKEKNNNLSLCMKLCFVYVPSLECRFIVSKKKKKKKNIAA